MTSYTAPQNLRGGTVHIRRATLVGMFVNLGLAALKFALGWLGRSQALVADAVHSLSDLSTDMAVLFGVKYWSAPADDDHPYGHGRIETIITAAIGLVLAGVALEIAYVAITSIRAGSEDRPHWIALVGAVASIIAKETLYRWTRSVGRNVKSPAFTANAWHHRTDALSSVPVALAVGVAVVRPSWQVADHLGALIVAVLILKVSWDIVTPALEDLSDHRTSDKDRHAIEMIASSVPGVGSAHAVRTRRLGGDLGVDLHITVNPELTVRSGHDISEHVKASLLEKGPGVRDVVVHLEPGAPSEADLGES